MATPKAKQLINRGFHDGSAGVLIKLLLYRGLNRVPMQFLSKACRRVQAIRIYRWEKAVGPRAVICCVRLLQVLVRTPVLLCAYNASGMALGHATQS